MNTLFLLAGDMADRQRHAGVRHVDDHVDLVDVVPLVGDLRTDVRLVLVIAADHLDFHVGMVLGEVGDRHLGGRDRARSADIGVEARHVAQHADLHVHLLGVGPSAGENRGQSRQS